MTTDDLREKIADELCRQRTGLTGEQSRALNGGNEYWNKQLANADLILSLLAEAQREAFVAGANWAWGVTRVYHDAEITEAEAARRYPGSRQGGV